MKCLLVVCLITLASSQAHSQADSLARKTSTLRGTVTAASTGLPIIGARVKVLTTKLGGITNSTGEYRIQNMAVGHYSVTVTSNEFASQTQEVVVTSAHQAVLDFSLQERRSEKGDTLNVYGTLALTPVNPFALSSVTPFSVEDVNRYAAAFQDPSRMAENFAGVYGRGSTNNYLVVRGGSPTELLWRLDGIDIPNPNHFGKNGSTGGLVSAINSAMLGNSDFFSGAFPAEYGTRLSAVFDLHTRNGNTENTEGRLEASLNGLEALAEGPLPKLEGASYLVGYRHSTIEVLRNVGILSSDYTDLPDFDDAMLKLHIPAGERNQINMTGLWGAAHVNVQSTTNEELGSGSGILVGGIDWQHLYSDALLGHVYVNYAGNRYEEGLGYFSGTEKVYTGYTTAKTTLTYTPNAFHSIEAGASAQRGNYELQNIDGYRFDTSFYSNDYTAFLNWNWRIAPPLVLNTGVFSQYMYWHLPWIASQFVVTDSTWTLEPRVSLAWSPEEAHTFSLAFGIHEQPEPFAFTKAAHYVAGYTFRASDDLLIKAETYLKHYTDVPIHASTLDDYSLLNEGYASRIDFSDLTNKGTGRTYGAELTVLKHYSSGYFVTGTASLVRQEFAGSNGIWHFGTFDNVYILNAVSGFDIALSPSSMMTLGEKFTI